MNITYAQAIEYSKNLNKQYGRTYYFATRFFPKKIREHIYALYGFVRVADNFVDTTADLKKGGEDFIHWTQVWRNVEKGETPTLPEMIAFDKTVKEIGIKQEYIDAFLDAMYADTYKHRYENYEELVHYMYGSATVVGLMMVQILGDEKKEALPYARALGEAMQLSNFLRDIREDYEVYGRIYIPQEDLQCYTVTEDDIKNHVIDDSFKALMKFEIARNRKLYEYAEQGYQYLPKRMRFGVAVSALLYKEILTEIEKADYDIFSKRHRVSTGKKILLTLKIALHI